MAKYNGKWSIDNTGERLTPLGRLRTLSNLLESPRIDFDQEELKMIDVRLKELIEDLGFEAE